MQADHSTKGALTEPSAADQTSPLQYEIRLKGHLDARWSGWFDGLSVTHKSDGTTTVHGPVADQAALHGLLQKVRDIGMPLISITQVSPHQRIDPPLTEHPHDRRCH